MANFKVERTQVQKEAIADAFRNFDFVLARVLEIYIAKRHNAEVYTRPEAIRDFYEQYRIKTLFLREEWGVEIRNGVDLYLRLKEILD